MTSQAAKLEIDRIDQAIDANRAAMIRRLGFNPNMSAAQWQRAWDRCPDLEVRDRDLHRQRGDAQFRLPFAERSLISMRNHAKRLAANA